MLSVLRQIFKLDKRNILTHLNVILNKYLKRNFKQNQVCAVKFSFFSVFHMPVIH